MPTTQDIEAGLAPGGIGGPEPTTAPRPPQVSFYRPAPANLPQQTAVVDRQAYLNFQQQQAAQAEQQRHLLAQQQAEETRRALQAEQDRYQQHQAQLAAERALIERRIAPVQRARRLVGQAATTASVAQIAEARQQQEAALAALPDAQRRQAEAQAQIGQVDVNGVPINYAPPPLEHPQGGLGNIVRAVASVAGQVAPFVGPAVTGPVGNLDIPYSGPAAQKVGEAAKFAAQQGAFGPVGRTGAGQSAAEFVASSAVPRQVWQAALEFVPGVGTIPDLAAAVRAGNPEAVGALTRAGERLGASDAVKTALKTLGSETGALQVGGKAAGEGEGVAAGIIERAQTARDVQQGRHVLEGPNGAALDYRGSHINDVNAGEVQGQGVGSALLDRAVGDIRAANPGAVITADLNSEGGARVFARRPGARFLSRTGEELTPEQAIEAAAKREGPTVELHPPPATTAERAPRAAGPTAPDITEQARRVEGEVIPPPDLGVSRTGRPRLLPFAQSLDEAAARIPNTPGMKIAEAAARVPGVKGVISLFNRSALARSDPLEALTVLYRRILNQGEQGARYGIDTYLKEQKFPFDIGGDGIVTNLPLGSRFGKKATSALVPPGTKAGGFEGEHIIDILERATRADVGKHITQAQWDWTQTARNLIDDGLDDLVKARGLEPGSDAARRYLEKNFGFQQGEHYFPRNVVGREGVQAARSAVGPGGIGTKKFFEKSRVHQYVAQGVLNGLDYADPRVSVENFLMAIRRATADEYLLNVARKLGRTRGELGIGEHGFAGAIPGRQFGREGVIAARTSEIPGLRGRIYPADVIDTVEKHLTDTGNRWLANVDRYSGLLRTAKAGLDVGAPFIQGWPLALRNPAAWARATVKSYSAALSPAARARYLLENRGVIQEYLDNGGELSTPEFLDAVRQGGLLQGARRNPIVHRAEATFDTFMDAGRIELWKALRTKGRPEDAPGLMGIVRDVLGAPSPIQAGTAAGQTRLENMLLFFSSRYRKSPLALAGHLLGSGVEAREATKALGGYLAGTSMIMYGFAKAAGMKDDEIRDMFNPATGKRFMSVRIGGNYVGVGGSYRALMQLAAKSAYAAKNDPTAFVSKDFTRNPLLYYFRAGTAPITGAAITAATGYDFIGNKVDSPKDYLRMLGDTATPLTIDAVMNSQGSASDRVVAGATSFLGLRQVPLNDADHLDIARDAEARQQGFENFGDMKRQRGTSRAIAEVNAANAGIAALNAKVINEGLQRRQDKGEQSITDVLTPFRDEQAQADANPDLADPQAWIADHKARRQRQAGALSLWAKDNPDRADQLDARGKHLDPYNLPENAPPDDLKAAYLKVFKSHQTQTGGVDDQDALSADLDRFQNGLNPAQQADLAGNLSLQSSPREIAYAAAAKTFSDTGYYDRQQGAFDSWLQGLQASSAPFEVKQEAQGWKKPEDLMNYAKGLEAQHGNAPEKFTTLGIWSGWENYAGKQNQKFLATHPEVDALAVQWGYQTRVHSAEAARLYTQRTGLRPPLPAQ